ncbi:MAG: 2-C-methyl-D-erythritol 2,4-cyclodiphosphate synthase [Dehalococcoidia bacterium]|nr:2-C-methyl-D-erythritol 2,4-cyclodiphosphate synthase [Dehalococcoidia bacterium]MDW8119457.1 2-C-methyl-D-erythritol 2,4-cyclodiphosphate synthase [Chloroflexota bacterium]
MRTRIGFGWDIHRLVEGRRLVLGGVEIPFPRGLLGHSDGDALTHAIIDALLGAAALGDIGTHFPPTDPRYKDAHSLGLLAQVMQMLHRQGYRLGNLDCTLIAERPHLRPFLDAMRQKLAHSLGVPVQHVSIKAKTAEGLGPLGQQEAIAAYAVALLEEQV